MASLEKFVLSSQSTLLSTELNSLANNALAIGSAFDNTVGQTGDGYTLCDIELVTGTWGGAPSLGTCISLWFLQTQDGTNYEDGDASTTPARMPDVILPLRTVSTAQRVIKRALVPWGKFKPLAKNDATAQTMNATGNTIKIRMITRQSV
jgi:hypothetical protein